MKLKYNEAMGEYKAMVKGFTGEGCRKRKANLVIKGE
jgi:hypothetical protein